MMDDRVSGGVFEFDTVKITKEKDSLATGSGITRWLGVGGAL